MTRFVLKLLFNFRLGLGEVKCKISETERTSPLILVMETYHRYLSIFLNVYLSIRLLLYLYCYKITETERTSPLILVKETYLSFCVSVLIYLSVDISICLSFSVSFSIYIVTNNKKNFYPYSCGKSI